MAVYFRRCPIGRQWETWLRFRGRYFVSFGDTNSNFYRPGWKTIDLVDADFICDLRKDSLPFDDEILDVVYSSHLIEHVSYGLGLNLLHEIWRCLKRGGLLRLVTPDMDLLLDRYQAKDWQFFLRADGQFILNRVCKGTLPPELLLIHNRLIGWFASYSGRMDVGGGPVVEREVLENKIGTLSKYEFRDWCVSLLEPGRIYAHVHLYDYEELHMALKKVGFRNVQKSSWGKSRCSAMINPPIDRIKHQAYSLYLEAMK